MVERYDSVSTGIPHRGQSQSACRMCLSPQAGQRAGSAARWSEGERPAGGMRARDSLLLGLPARLRHVAQPEIREEVVEELLLRRREVAARLLLEHRQDVDRLVR